MAPTGLQSAPTIASERLAITGRIFSFYYYYYYCPFQQEQLTSINQPWPPLLQRRPLGQVNSGLSKLDGLLVGRPAERASGNTCAFALPPSLGQSSSAGRPTTRTCWRPALRRQGARRAQAFPRRGGRGHNSTIRRGRPANGR